MFGSYQTRQLVGSAGLQTHDPYNSHLLPLTYYAARDLPEGNAVVELGGGDVSTPALVGMAARFERGDVHTLETNPDWFRRIIASRLGIIGANLYTAHLCTSEIGPDWHLSKPPQYIDWSQVGLVFLDHGNGPARARNVRELAEWLPTGAVLLVHDTEPENEAFYQWGDCWDAWKFCRIWDQFWPHCRALSMEEERL